MFNLCCQYLQSLNSVQQKLFVLQLLKDRFQMYPPGVAGRLGFASPRCNPKWSPHSPDLNTLDFYLWGYLKDRVYKHNPQTIPDLKAAITAAIRANPERGVQEGYWELCQELWPWGASGMNE